MSNNLEHEGVITKLENNVAYVSIVSKSACSSCHVKGMCNASEQMEKIMEILCDEKRYAVGEKVVVKIKEQMGYKAILWAYLFPFLVMIISFFGLSFFHLSELVSGIGCVVVLIPYYLCLYGLRNKMQKTFIFTLEKDLCRENSN